MNKRKILELEAVDAEIVEERVLDEEKGDKEIDLVVKFQQADKINGNNRLYPRALLKREIDRLNLEIGEGRTIWGQAFHPERDDPFGKPTDITHEWKGLWLEKDGSAKGKLTLLPTEHGKTLQVLVKRGRLGISSRGTGNVVEKTKTVDGKEIKYLEVQDNYKMDTPGDWVVSPAVRDAGNTSQESLQLLESRLNEKDDEDSKENKEETMKKEKKGPVHYTADKVYHEAKALGINPKTYAQMLNEKEQKKAEVEAKEKELGLSREQADAIYRSAHLAGKKISAEDKIQILEDWQKPLPSQQMTREEALEEADKRERIRESEKQAFFARERAIAGAPRKVSLERRVEILTDKLNDLINRFDKALSEDKE